MVNQSRFHQNTYNITQDTTRNRYYSYKNRTTIQSIFNQYNDTITTLQQKGI